jgi:hypothetical protein
VSRSDISIYRAPFASAILASAILASAILASAILASAILASAILASAILASAILASAILAPRGVTQGSDDLAQPLSAMSAPLSAPLSGMVLCLCLVTLFCICSILFAETLIGVYNWARHRYHDGNTIANRVLVCLVCGAFAGTIALGILHTTAPTLCAAGDVTCRRAAFRADGLDFGENVALMDRVYAINGFRKSMLLPTTVVELSSGTTTFTVTHVGSELRSEIALVPTDLATSDDLALMLTAQTALLATMPKLRVHTLSVASPFRQVVHIAKSLAEAPAFEFPINTTESLAILIGHQDYRWATGPTVAVYGDVEGRVDMFTPHPITPKPTAAEIAYLTLLTRLATLLCILVGCVMCWLIIGSRIKARRRESWLANQLASARATDRANEAEEAAEAAAKEANKRAAAILGFTGLCLQLYAHRALIGSLVSVARDWYKRGLSFAGPARDQFREAHKAPAAVAPAAALPVRDWMHIAGAIGATLPETGILGAGRLRPILRALDGALGGVSPTRPLVRGVMPRQQRFVDDTPDESKWARMEIPIDQPAVVASLAPAPGPTATPATGPGLAPAAGPVAGPAAGPVAGPAAGPVAGPVAGQVLVKAAPAAATVYVGPECTDGARTLPTSVLPARH